MSWREYLEPGTGKLCIIVFALLLPGIDFCHADGCNVGQRNDTMTRGVQMAWLRDEDEETDHTTGRMYRYKITPILYTVSIYIYSLEGCCI